MTKNQLLSVLGAVVLILAGWTVYHFHNQGPQTFGVTNQCASGQTCLPSLELTGPNGGVTNSLQIDTGIFDTAGTAVFEGAVSLTSTFKLGTSGTAQSNQITTTCAPKADVSIAATSTGYAYCTGVTGVTSSDNVLAQFSTSTANVTQAKDDFWIVSAKASTTAGAIDFLVYNGTGTAAAPAAVGRAASTTSVIASH